MECYKTKLMIFLNVFTQDTFIANLFHHKKVAATIARKQSFPNPDEKHKYMAGKFLMTIHVIVNNLDSSSSHCSQDSSASSCFGPSVDSSQFFPPNTHSFAWSMNDVDLDVDYYDDFDLE